MSAGTVKEKEALCVYVFVCYSAIAIFIDTHSRSLISTTTTTINKLGGRIRGGSHSLLESTVFTRSLSQLISQWNSRLYLSWPEVEEHRTPHRFPFTLVKRVRHTARTTLQMGDDPWPVCLLWLTSPPAQSDPNPSQTAANPFIHNLHLRSAIIWWCWW